MGKLLLQVVTLCLSVFTVNFRTRNLNVKTLNQGLKFKLIKSNAGSFNHIPLAISLELVIQASRTQRFIQFPHDLDSDRQKSIVTS